MRVALVYICVTQGVRTAFFASRFVGTYMTADPGHPHETLIVCNGGPLSTELGLMFEPLNPQFFPRENDPGWDLSGYIAAAHGPAAEVDCMVCMGESIYFHRLGWLARIAEEWNRYGPGMYGFYSSFIQRPHMNTTAFATHPRLLREYPFPVRTHGERYNFEHGHNSFWRYVKNRGMPTRLVTFDGAWEPFLWRFPPDILFRGTQENCLCLCNHTERYANADNGTKAAWSAHADTTHESLR